MTTHDLTITYGTSRGAETYGYGLVTLRENGKKKASACGGGYDMRGTVFANWLEIEYQAQLRNKLRHKTRYIYREGGDGFKAREGKNTLYGSTLYADTGEVKLDGGCGFDSIRRIAEAIGLSVRLISTGKTSDVIVVTEAG